MLPTVIVVNYYEKKKIHQTKHASVNIHTNTCGTGQIFEEDLLANGDVIMGSSASALLIAFSPKASQKRLSNKL